MVKKRIVGIMKKKKELLFLIKTNIFILDEKNN